MQRKTKKNKVHEMEFHEMFHREMNFSAGGVPPSRASNSIHGWRFVASFLCFSAFLRLFGFFRVLRGSVVLSLCTLCSLWLFDAEGQSNRVQCANLVYAGNKTSQCFSDKFVERLGQVTRIKTEPKFRKVRLDGAELSGYPFAVMTGQGRFTLTDKDRIQLKHYLTTGGFLLASAGCSDPQWARSFRGEILRLFPQNRLERLPLSHPLFRTVYKIERLDTKKGKGQTALEALTLNGRIVLIFSPDGLNDTENAESGCCCCGGNEILGAEFVNLNILAYCLLH
jgi:hypothetical protein